LFFTVSTIFTIAAVFIVSPTDGGGDGPGGGKEKIRRRYKKMPAYFSRHYMGILINLFE